MKLSFFIGLLFICQVCLAGHHYIQDRFPDMIEAQKIASRGADNTFEIKTHYPTSEEITSLHHAKTTTLTLQTDYLPSKAQLEILEKSNLRIILKLKDVYITAEQLNMLNASSISAIHLITSKFPTQNEVEIANTLKASVRFDMLPRRIPLEKEMRVIRNFASHVKIAFHHTMVPGPGQASYFNELKAHKIFVVHDEMPYGMDAEGLRGFTNASVEFLTTQRPIDNDVQILNSFAQPVTLNLLDVWPLTNDILFLITQIDVQKISVKDNGFHLLLNPEVMRSFSNSKTKVSFIFDRF